MRTGQCEIDKVRAVVGEQWNEREENQSTRWSATIKYFTGTFFCQYLWILKHIRTTHYAYYKTHTPQILALTGPQPYCSLFKFVGSSNMSIRPVHLFQYFPKVIVSKMIFLVSCKKDSNAVRKACQKQLFGKSANSKNARILEREHLRAFCEKWNGLMSSSSLFYLLIFSFFVWLSYICVCTFAQAAGFKLSFVAPAIGTSWPSLSVSVVFYTTSRCFHRSHYRSTPHLSKTIQRTRRGYETHGQHCWTESLFTCRTHFIWFIPHAFIYSLIISLFESYTSSHQRSRGRNGVAHSPHT